MRMQALFLFCGLFDLGSSVRSDRSQEGLDNRNQGGGLLFGTIFDQEPELADRWIFDLHARIENLLGIYLKPANQREQNRHFRITTVVLNVQDRARITNRALHYQQKRARSNIKHLRECSLRGVLCDF